jgi:hypothetical protein
VDHSCCYRFNNFMFCVYIESCVISVTSYLCKTRFRNLSSSFFLEACDVVAVLADLDKKLCIIRCVHLLVGDVTIFHSLIFHISSSS